MSALDDVVKSGKEDSRYKKLMGSTPDTAEEDGVEEEGGSSSAECYGRAFDALKSDDREGYIKAMQEAENEEGE
jgi:hypothetical protein